MNNPNSQRKKDKNLDYLLDDLPPTLEQHDRELDETYIRRLRREIKRLRRAQSDGPADDARDVVKKHRRQVEMSPGVGREVQRYAILVCNDILDDLPQRSATDSEANK